MSPPYLPEVPNEALLPEGWPRPKGYANGVAATGRQVYVAGQVGWTPEGVWTSDDFGEQAKLALANVAAVLRAGGAQPKHIVRQAREVVEAYGPDIGAAFRALIGHYDIAMTAVEVTALMEDRAKVEIEVTAVVPG